MTEPIGPPGPEDEARANVDSGHAHHRHPNETFHLVLMPAPSSGSKAEAAFGAIAHVWAGDPPLGVRLVAAGRPPVMCDVRRMPAWDTEAAGWAVWLATPRGPLPPGTRLVADYLPGGAVIAGRGFPPLYSKVEPRRPLPPGPETRPDPRPGPPRPGPKPGTKTGARPGPKPPPRRARRDPPAPVAPAPAEADTGHGAGRPWNPASRPAPAHEWRRPPDSPPDSDADPGWCPAPPKGCGYHLNSRGHKITCLGEDP